MLADLAWAGPPLISDDPHTVGARRVEVIVAAQSVGHPGGAFVDAPVIDLTLGVADGLDLTFVSGPAFVLESLEGPFTTENIAAGIKWQPLAGRRLAASFTPAFGTSLLSVENLLVQLPIQLEYRFDRVALGLDAGYSLVRSDADAWNASTYATYDASSSLVLLSELWALSSPLFPGADFGTGVGIDWMFGNGKSLLAMLGTGIASRHSMRVEWVGYIGIQWAFQLFDRQQPPLGRAGRRSPDGFSSFRGATAGASGLAPE